jgi:hypothetical protein
LSEAWLIRNSPAKAGTGDPDPGARAGEARAQARGACRRERGEKPDTDGRANLSRVRTRGASFTAPRQNLFRNSVCRLSRLNQTLVVKISDTSHPGKERVRIPPLTHALWRCPGKGCHAPQRRFSERSTCVAVTDTDIACSPACAFDCRCKNVGKAVVKMSVTSIKALRRRAGSRPARPQGRRQHRPFPANYIHGPW